MTDSSEVTWSEPLVQRVFAGRFVAGSLWTLSGATFWGGGDLSQDGAKRDDFKQEEPAGGFTVLRF
ncbi:MAG: hypothetical protein ACK44Q_15730, partial [Pirellulaceae bacterium]